MLHHQAALTILRIAERIHQDAAAALKPFDLTVSQFNILRILRGSPQGLSCGQIAERMIHRDPDVTRLLDRMEHRNLLVRSRSEADRRIVTALISSAGLDLLRRVDSVVMQTHQRQFTKMSALQIQHLVDLISQLSFD